MSAKYKIAFTHKTGSVTKEQQVVVEVDKEPTIQQAREAVREQFLLEGRAPAEIESVAVISVVPYP
ncbi:hypothetical protein TUM12370_29870 [Salmonella enterica subsp. enterica serovar Choleraesuis]|nr:hypothetical protein TUM12370_29870 [Salmonella enterica subsp. enterica serovar Choleraesuis]